jgi:SulP family sulfate permease
LIGQGIANIICLLFDGFVATDAITRISVNIRSGGNCPISGIVHSGVLVGVIILLAPLAKNIPLATLAAILFVVAYNMSEMHRVLYLLKQSPGSDTVVLVSTFL